MQQNNELQPILYKKRLIVPTGRWYIWHEQIKLFLRIEDFWFVCQETSKMKGCIPQVTRMNQDYACVDVMCSAKQVPKVIDRIEEIGSALRQSSYSTKSVRQYLQSVDINSNAWDVITVVQHPVLDDEADVEMNDHTQFLNDL